MKMLEDHFEGVSAIYYFIDSHPKCCVAACNLKGTIVETVMELIGMIGHLPRSDREFKINNG